MKCIVTDTISFLSNTFPKIYSSLYLNYLKQYSSLYDVNKTQLRALVFMRNYGEISMTELCSKLNIEKGSLTSMIDDLSDKGYVYREKNLKDRRKYMIIITEEGKKIAADFTERLSNDLEEKFFKLNDEDRKKYLEAIETLDTLLNKSELN
ncbi:MarR family winged helix-turn-helix transcriptional regulator [Intestinibacter sp.]|uniref:MarR family winged helix-turn-helix transcriptional regulator n=1 Tax=Intestinibacter sp. TaxID=1965304 RepID=UPI002A764A9D|nr:MarR family transcriptional regulator [Intestinibacter sp.]MDY2735971.1 MarR family transcriptional regulator [Intestinibacter sp.]MDY4575856.1 MarR family transcriptional regulator [Intestinibacter sp.]